MLFPLFLHPEIPLIDDGFVHEAGIDVDEKSYIAINDQKVQTDNKEIVD